MLQQQLDQRQVGVHDDAVVKLADLEPAHAAVYVVPALQRHVAGGADEQRSHHAAVDLTPAPVVDDAGSGVLQVDEVGAGLLHRLCLGVALKGELARLDVAAEEAPLRLAGALPEAHLGAVGAEDGYVHHHEHHGPQVGGGVDHARPELGRLDDLVPELPAYGGAAGAVDGEAKLDGLEAPEVVGHERVAPAVQGHLAVVHDGVYGPVEGLAPRQVVPRVHEGQHGDVGELGVDHRRPRLEV